MEISASQSHVARRALARLVPAVLPVAGAAVLLSGLMAPVPAVAQTDPAARALIQQLLPRTSATTTRGIRLPAGSTASAVPQSDMPAIDTVGSSHQGSAPRQAAVTPPVQAPVPATTVSPDVGAASISVTFPSGSADLMPQAIAALTPLGLALASNDLAVFRFRIEGHTDSVGPREMNQSLSERRAAAVRDFLVQRFGISASRLETVGRGEDDLLVRTADEVSEQRNRRVQVVNLGN